MYRIKLAAQARKELRAIKIMYQEAIDAALEEIKEDPFIGKPLTRELIGKYSYRIGIYRIIYTINKKDQIIHILTVGHRAIVYE